MTAFFAITRIGAIAVPVNTFYKAPELAWQLNHCDAQLLVTVDRFLHNDYLARLEEGLSPWPNRGEQMFLQSAPYLRKIVVRSTGRPVPAWAYEFDEFTKLGSSVGDAVLGAVEANVTPADRLCVLYTSGSSAAPKGGRTQPWCHVASHGVDWRELFWHWSTGYRLQPEPLLLDRRDVQRAAFHGTERGGGSYGREIRCARTLAQLEKHRVTIAVGCRILLILFVQCRISRSMI